MIEIIKRGTKRIITCKKCGCEFSFDEIEDVVRIPDPIHQGLTVRVVPCPQCNHGNPVDKETIR